MPERLSIGADVVEAAAKAWFEAGREREEREGLTLSGSMTKPGAGMRRR
jgi:hypothetical protein